MTQYHITRAVLAPATGSLRALLADSGETDAGHRLVWTLFPGDDAKRDFVYRETGRGAFMIISQRTARDPHKLWDLQSQEYKPEPRSGEHYSFLLRANPSTDIFRKGKRSLRVDAVMHAKRQARERGEEWNLERERTAALDWLYKREESIGVRFDREACDASRHMQASISPNKTASEQRPIEYAMVDYEGLLEVVDGERFAEKLKTGIGRAKAFGCGLMLIRRA